MARSHRNGSMPGLIVVVLWLAGCGNFENPLNWEESPVADSLVGSWRGVAGNETGTLVLVSRKDQGLWFEMTYPKGAPAATKQDKRKHRAEFRADLLGSESVDVLQIHASTYEEFDEQDESIGSAGGGYIFVRIDHSPGEGAAAHWLDRIALGRVAEAEFPDGEVRIAIRKVSSCLGEELRLASWRELWEAINEEIEGETKSDFLAALDGGGDAIAKFERELAELDDLVVDPYQELAHLRTCIARYLPSESLGLIFSSHADRVFTDRVDRFVRVADNPVRSP